MGGVTKIISKCLLTLIFKNCLNKFRDRIIHKLNPKNTESQYVKVNFNWSGKKVRKRGRNTYWTHTMYQGLESNKVKIATKSYHMAGNSPFTVLQTDTMQASLRHSQLQMCATGFAIICTQKSLSKSKSFYQMYLCTSVKMFNFKSNLVRARVLCNCLWAVFSNDKCLLLVLLKWIFHYHYQLPL